MPNHTIGLHHYHLRQRIHQKHEPFPSKNKLKRFIDKSVYVVGAFGLLMTLPQITLIWIDKNAAGVSAGSWAAFMIVATFWLFYGILHKEKPIIVVNSVNIVLNAVIVVGTLLYG